MKNIIIVAAGSQPVPAVKGGAVETLIEYILEENEKYAEYEFTVVSPYDSVAVQNQGKYEHTKFIFVRKKKWISSVLNFTANVIAKVFRKVFWLDDLYYGKKVKDALKSYNISGEYLLIENNAHIVEILDTLNIPLILHIHNDYHV